MKLPDAKWHQRASLSAIIEALGGAAKIRYVGGAVRDTLMGSPVKDVDLATVLKPEEVRDRLEAAGIKAVPTGIDHGTITAVTSDGPVEITTLRRDVSTDGRRATVTFSEDWKEDAARRDFTINALSADPETLAVFDYFGGLEDLQDRRIRFIGSAKDRIAEDHLRIMRYFRFLARFGLHDVDQEAFDACRGAAADLSRLSRERIADELMKLLATDDPLYAVEEMIAADVFANIVEEIDGEAAQVLAPLILRERKHEIAPDPIRRLVALLPKDVDKADAIAKSLRMSNKLRKSIRHRVPEQAGAHLPSAQSNTLSETESGLRRGTPTPPTIRALAYYTNPEAARDCALLFGAEADIASMLAKLKDWHPPILPITGGDLIAMGMITGPIVSKTLAEVERAWVDGGFPDEASTRKLAENKIKSG